MIRHLLAALVVFAPVAAPALILDGHATQGGLMTGRAEPGAAVMLNGEDVPVTPAGDFVIGFGRDAKKTATLSVRHADGRTETRQLAIAPRKFKVQRIDGLPSRSVSPDPEDLKRIMAEQKLFNRARGTITPESWFRGGFVWPAKGRISGVYGSQRILNGKPRRPHSGVDIAAPEGTPIVAAAAGVVRIAHDGMFFTGKTVHIDHGLGVGTVYAHMSALAVKEGERVKKGQLIGRIGKTGRATGPHLHWGLTWRSLRLDPALVVGPTPAK